MSEEIGAYDAKTKLSEILRRVESGESFTITKRGRAIAELVPSRQGTRQQAARAVENLLAMKKITVSDADLKALARQGRK